MRATTKPRSSTGASTTRLGGGTLWLGEIRMGTGDLCIEGSVEGTILSEGVVTIEATGVVKGAIHAQRLSVLGHAEGVFQVEGCLEILGTGWVEGEVELGSLVVDQGGTLLGTCAQIRPAGAKAPVPLVPRRDEFNPERSGPPASGTHGGINSASPSRSPGWIKP